MFFVVYFQKKTYFRLDAKRALAETLLKMPALRSLTLGAILALKEVTAFPEEVFSKLESLQLYTIDDSMDEFSKNVKTVGCCCYNVVLLLLLLCY